MKSCLLHGKLNALEKDVSKRLSTSGKAVTQAPTLIFKTFTNKSFLTQKQLVVLSEPT